MSHAGADPDNRTQRERMLAGDLYVADDPELSRESLHAMRLTAEFNRSTADDPAERRRILADPVASPGDLVTMARAIVDSSAYMTIGTADDAGRPWVSPVYFSAEAYRDYYWISSPDALHSRNLATRPDISIVVFDSRAAVGTGQGVYMAAVAEELTGHPDFPRGVDVYNAPAAARGARTVTPADLRTPAPYRLYRATASRHWVLDPHRSPDQRTAVRL